MGAFTEFMRGVLSILRPSQEKEILEGIVSLAESFDNKGQDNDESYEECGDDGDVYEESEERTEKEIIVEEAMQGVAKAQYLVGFFYYYGLGGCTQDYNNAVEWLYKAAEQDYAKAQELLGKCYKEGNGVDQNTAEAIKWYEKAAEQGNSHAQYDIGELYEKGTGVTPNMAEAIKWYEKAAEQGLGQAQTHLGHLHEEGNGVPQDYEEAASWYRKAMTNGDLPAQYDLERLFIEGKVTPLQYEQAVKHLIKKAERGDVSAQSALGDAYESGRGVARDYDKAAEWYEKAAEQGEAHAQIQLGKLYEDGNGVSMDYEEAAYWFREAAEQGDARAQFYLGRLYASGCGVIKNEVEAAKWIRKAAEQDDAEAQYVLGMCYVTSRGVNENFAEALKWFRKAAEQGFAAAQYQLGDCYCCGLGVNKDFEEGVRWFRKAAEQGYAEAQYHLGLYYVKGMEIPIDFEEGVKWFRKAAEQGHAEAQLIMGAAYSNGEGVIQDYNEAARWFSMAAGQGNTIAQEELDELIQEGKIGKDTAGRYVASGTESVSNSQPQQPSPLLSAVSSPQSKAVQQQPASQAIQSSQAIPHPQSAQPVQQPPEGSSSEKACVMRILWIMVFLLIALVVLLWLRGNGRQLVSARDEAVPAGFSSWHSNQTEEEGETEGSVVEITPEFIVAIHKYDILGDYHEGMAAARDATTHKWGFINTKGKEVIECQYEEVCYFADGLTPVRNEEGKYGYIDKKGTVVIPFVYAYALPLSEGIAITTVNADWQYPKLTFLDTSGNVIEKLSNMNFRGYVFENGESGDISLETEGFYNGAASFLCGIGDEDEVDWSETIYVDKEGNIVERPENCITEFTYEITEDGIVDNRGKLIATYPKSLGYSLSYEITYDGIDYHSTPRINNGVILSKLEHSFYDWEHEDVVIYGYVNLDGNTTFTEEDWAKIKKAQKIDSHDTIFVEREVEKQEENIDRAAVVRNAYLGKVREMKEQFTARGEYNEWDCWYFLLDITHDGTPELWITTGALDAHSMDKGFCVYTYGDKCLINLGNDWWGNHSCFYAGSDYVIS